MEYRIHSVKCGANELVIRNTAFNEIDLPEDRLQVFSAAGGKIIDYSNLLAAVQQTMREI